MTRLWNGPEIMQDGDMACFKCDKNYVVDAFIYGEDNSPRWFTEATKDHHLGEIVTLDGVSTLYLYHWSRIEHIGFQPKEGQSLSEFENEITTRIPFEKVPMGSVVFRYICSNEVYQSLPEFKELYWMPKSLFEVMFRATTCPKPPSEGGTIIRKTNTRAIQCTSECG